jgi:hypothetical protein
MSGNLKNRLNKVEAAMILSADKFPKYLCTTSQQIGLDGETVREETDEEVIARHLAKHPEDVGQKFNIINRVFVSPKKDGDGLKPPCDSCCCT